jgi:lysyl-tRNA synthetase class 2
MEQNPSSYEQDRRAKRDRIRVLGLDPYGQRTDGIAPLADIKALYRAQMGHEGGPSVKGAGRILLKRDMGKLSFLTLRDESGDLQVALDRKRLDERSWELRGLLDLGDILVAQGKLGTTNKGEITIWADGFELASKALLPPPAKWEGLADVELRYRQRYVDLWANPDVMKLLRMRMRIVEEIRRYMAARGYLEVETPMMQPVAGGAAAKPFVTHHNALDMDLYLRIAPELYLKRLLVGGFSKVFELNRNFRNEGISPRHNPEFTMLEAYEAFGSWQTMAELVEDLICTVAQNVLGTLRIVHRAGEGAQEKVIDLSRRPWRRAGMVDLVSQETGWRFDGRRIQEAAPQVWEKLREHGARDVVLAWTAFEQLAEAYEKLVEPTLIDPCFVTHLPSVLIPLARESREHPGFADVYELAINGQEISPGYSELNDPDVQAHHFQHQVGEDQQKMDDDFVTALKHGMPPAGGMGLGVDRLVMMLTGAPSIRDVILFPLMRPT